MTNKNILVSGATGSIGTQLRLYLETTKDNLEASSLDLRKNDWRHAVTSKYSAFVHLAGLAHKRGVSLREHQQVNRDLAYEAALAARNAGIPLFIFMSSMAVYGLEGTLNTPLIIDKETPLQPKTAYGCSKWQAEQELTTLHNEDTFKIAILRPPMVYGKNCKGNYVMLQTLSSISPIWPDIHNQRSVIHVDSLVQFIVNIVKTPVSGVFFPQDQQYMDIHDVVTKTRNRLSKKVYFSRALTKILPLAARFSTMPLKAFGNLCYSHQLDKLEFPIPSHT